MPDAMRARRAAGIILALAACSAGSDPVARSIGAAVERELGVRPRSVTCRRDTCTVILPAGDALEVAVGRDRAWTSAELIDPRPVVDRITADLASLGVPQAVDCGALRLAAEVPTTIECRLGGGGAAWATIDADGGIDVELALTAAIAEARRAGPGDDALEALSRALDPGDTDDDPEGEDDEQNSPDASVRAAGL